MSKKCKTCTLAGGHCSKGFLFMAGKFNNFCGEFNALNRQNLWDKSIKDKSFKSKTIKDKTIKDKTTKDETSDCSGIIKKENH